MTTTITPDTLDSLLSAVRSDPLNPARWGVYADALDDAGRHAAAAAARTVYGWLSPDGCGLDDTGAVAFLSAVSCRGWPAVSAELSAANGRRRVRVLSAADVAATARGALADPDGWEVTNAGRVANTYHRVGFGPVWTTLCLAAVRGDGLVTVAVTVGRGNRAASSLIPFGLNPYRRHDREQFRSWADQFPRTPEETTV